MNPDKLWAIVPAAGIGNRMNHALPKQYLPIHQKPILAHTLSVICQMPQLHQVIIPLHPRDQYWQRLIQLPFNNIVTVAGGQLRDDSVMNALEYIKKEAKPQDWVLVHDAVRPCVTIKGLTALFTQIQNDHIGGLWGVPVRDTLKKVDEGKARTTVSRADLWHAQTPQIFRFEPLYQSLLQAKHDKIEITDEASAIEHAGYHPKMVRGSYDNIKITWPEDLISAALWLQYQESACESDTDLMPIVL